MRLEEIAKYFNPLAVAADIMYARFFLCHLRNPLDVVGLWRTQVNSGGLLFVDETDTIDTELEVFRTWLAMAEGMIASQGASLHVGKELGSAQYQTGVVLNKPAVVPVTNRLAASWFLPNTQTICIESEYVLEKLGPKERDAIRRDLERLKTEDDARSSITWRLRRLVLRKRVD